MPKTAEEPLTTDHVLDEAVERAREVLLTVAEPGSVGEHLGMRMVAKRLGVHRFACRSKGYPGWEWAVSVTRVPRGREATVCETNLLPGEQALLSPQWLPWAQRLSPGDVGPGDVLPYRDDDPHLEPGFEATGDQDVDRVGFFELGLGRARVLSRAGRQAAAERWRAGESGPQSPVAVKATARCTTCGYLLPMQGALRQAFGVCANEWSPADGKVIALDYGCGAHSETHAAEPTPVAVGVPLLDDYRLDES